MKKTRNFENIKNQEWSVNKRWNPFNSFKLLAQVYRWEKIKRNRPVPQPVLVTVDPINVCNHRCVWCNADYILSQRHRKLSAGTLAKLANFLPRWQGSPDWPPGTEAVCVAGGGEPLLNKNTGEFINRLDANKIQIGVVTNGTKIADNVDPLSKCVWVGVSIDAGNPETFNKLKRIRDKNAFSKIIDGIAGLVDYGRSKRRTIANKSGGYGVSYKYLLHPENIGEIYEAAKLAKEIGCKNFHMRPASAPWDKLDRSELTFSAYDRQLYAEQIARAREMEDEKFGVYGITHKFNESFRKSNVFKKCYAVFMTAVFMPSAGDSKESIMGLCCDRRGDLKLELSNKMESVEEIARLWGSKRHWEIFDSINVATECPRCTYQPHNQIFERVIKQDSMTFRFI